MFDLTFDTYITRRIAGVAYVLGMVIIGLVSVWMLFSGLAVAFAAMSSSYTSGFGLVLFLATAIGAPVVALLSIIALRLGLEAGVALVAVAENTRRPRSENDKN